jgi:hypothetical protein
VKDHVPDLGSLDVVGQIDDVPFDASPSLTLDLPAGAYVFLCRYPGHYASGMHAVFTVT